MADQSHKPQGTFSKLMTSTSPKQEQKQGKLENQEIQENKNNSHDTAIPRHHDTMIPRNHDTMIPLKNDEIDLFELVRKSIKQIGKEAATHRFTIEEKNELADIEYT